MQMDYKLVLSIFPTKYCAKLQLFVDVCKCFFAVLYKVTYKMMRVLSNNKCNLVCKVSKNI